MERIFFAYGSSPEVVRETMKAASDHFAAHDGVDSCLSWEEMTVDGRLIASEVENALDEATLGVFEVSSLNLNVLYELGYAIGSGKRVVTLLDVQDAEARTRWERLALLSTAGYTGYRNSDHLRAELERIVVDSPGDALLDELLAGAKGHLDERRLVLVPSAKDDDAAREVQRVADSYEGLEVHTMDLVEYGTSPLAVLVHELYASAIALFHFTPDRAYLSDTVNPRVALLAGISRGLGRNIAILAESDGSDLSIDYRDLGIRYRNKGDVRKRVRTFLEAIDFESPQGNRTPARRHLSAELASLRFGAHVAESEEADLLGYFVETRDYRDVIDAKAVIFTGRKGTGKTANMLQAAAELRSDPRNLVVVVKPAGYEIEALVNVLSQIDERHLHDYLVEAVWKFLLYSEVAIALIDEQESKPAGIAPDSPLGQLRSTVESTQAGFERSFSGRLEKLVASLLTATKESAKSESIEDARQRMAVSIHRGVLRPLRSALGTALADRRRVAVLIDNLDKAWEKGSDLDALARLVLGLLTATGRVVDEFRRDSGGRQPVDLTLTAFLRSDIYAFVRDRAREPDKIQVAEIEWRDPDVLARVLEDRFIAGRDGKASANDLWSSYFVPEIEGVPTKAYILGRLQPRPRDLIFFANTAVARATNAKNAQITAEDVHEAERRYSQFAYEALLVEGVASRIDLESVLVQFAGERSVLTIDEVQRLIQTSGVPEDPQEVVVVLRQLGFLGIGVSASAFDYGGTKSEMMRADVLATKLAKSTAAPWQLEIHPAYRAYLSIEAGLSHTKT